MDGFKKIELPSVAQVKSAVQSINPVPSMKTKRTSNKNLKKRLAITVSVIGVIAVILLFILVFPVISLVKSAKVTQAQLKVLATSVKQQNIDQADAELQTTKTDLADTQQKLNVLGYLAFIPIANFYYNDGQHAMQAGTYGLDTAQTVINDLKPYADLLGLKGQGTFAGGTAEQRISTAVLTLGKITPDIGHIAQGLDNVKKEVDQIDPGHYPAFLFGKNIGAQLDSAKTLVDEISVGVNQARPLIVALPALLGENQAQKYLVLFQNDKELRPAGGFITAYAIFRIDKGAIQVERSDDIYPLDDSIPNKPTAPAPLIKYLHLSNPVFNLRDSNLSPDFITSMKTFRSMYDRAGGSEDINGIIAIDTHVLVNTIAILDNSITVDGTTYTTDNDPTCGCAQVLYSLENQISRPVNYVKTARKSVLGDMLNAIMIKALQSSPKKYWGPLFQSMITMTSEKHILFDLDDQQAQEGLEALNAAGQINQAFDNTKGDYLHINDANFGGDKANLFTTESVQDDYTVAGDGTITKTVTISYSNNHAPSDCNLEHGGLCLNSDLRDWIRIYVPKGSKLVSSKGSQVKVTTYDELGKTVIDGYTVIEPMHKATYSVTYTLPFKIQNNSALMALIQKQPGTDNNQYTVTFNGHQVDSFPLLTDKTLTVK